MATFAYSLAVNNCIFFFPKFISSQILQGINTLKQLVTSCSVGKGWVRVQGFWFKFSNQSIKSDEVE